MFSSIVTRTQVQRTLDLSNSTDSNILIPDSPLRKAHDIVLSDAAHDPFYLFRTHSAACGDDLATNVFGDSGGAVKGKQYRGFELSFGALDFGFAHIVGESRPFAQREVDQIVDAGYFVGY